MPFWYNYHNCLIFLISKLSTLKVDIFLQWKRIKLDHLLAVYKNLIQAFNIDHTVYIKPRKPLIVSIKPGPSNLSSLLSPSQVP